jgi:phosphoribosylglycinamide formyltransferase 1
MYKIAILSSGRSRGSNLKALTEYFQNNSLPVKISFVIRTMEFAPIIGVCGELNLSCFHIPYISCEQFEEKILDLAKLHGIHLLVLAGFLKKLSAKLLRELNIPVINIHPALLPQYGGPGMFGKAVHQAVFTSGDRESGATVHLVDGIYDHGKIIAQQRIDVSQCHSPEEIADKVISVEHQIYGPAIWSYLDSLNL